MGCREDDQVESSAFLQVLRTLEPSIVVEEDGLSNRRVIGWGCREDDQVESSAFLQVLRILEPSIVVEEDGLSNQLLLSFVAICSPQQH